MKKGHPLVSIIVPMYNAEKFISETLVSILHEREISIEAIVVNDKSTDRSLDRVREFHDERIRVLDGPGCGAPGAMNAGLANARGSIIMICDSDDLYPGTRIRSQVRWLDSHPEYDGICGKFTTIDSKGNLIAEMQSGDAALEITNELINGKLRTSFCTYAIRSSSALRVGGFRDFFEAGYDLDFQLRFGEAGRVVYVPENYYFYRLHPSSITHTQSNVVRQFFERTAFELQGQRRSCGLDDLQRGCPPLKPSSNRVSALSASEHIQGQLLGRAWREHQAGTRLSALRTGARALAVNPLNFHAWKSALALLLKSSGDVAS
jgi:glycosyltransferase involved in cell wall biosynthesis